jgi:hypothetical protein
MAVTIFQSVCLFYPFSMFLHTQIVLWGDCWVNNYSILSHLLTVIMAKVTMLF